MTEEQEQIEEFKKILEKFKTFPPKPVYEPSCLEICEYPGRRTEEICSRLLSFFFNTRNPHGMGTLFLNSLLELYCEKANEKIDIGAALSCCAECEVHTKEGRIDLLLVSENLVVCIENKLWAPLDNPLDDYYKYVEGEKGVRRALYIIISMREDVEDELLKHSSVHKDKYKVVFYREFVAKLKQNLGEYVASCNAKYLAILTDFIQFLDRKGGRMSNFTPEEIAFFIDNNASLETLINRRNEFVKEIEKIQHSRLEEIKELLKKKEPNDEWWIYANTDLGITIKEGIGLESGFDIKGRYNIQITIWQPYKWPEILENYRGELIKLHGRSSYNCDNTKWELKFDPLGENTSPEEIAEKLYSMCRQLNEIVKSVNK